MAMGFRVVEANSRLTLNAPRGAMPVNRYLWGQLEQQVAAKKVIDSDLTLPPG